MTAEMDKLNSAITKQKNYLDQLNRRIAVMDNRQIDQYARLFHERQAAENILQELQRERASRSPLGSSRGFFMGSQG
jgi:hypothetical protein